MNQNPTHVLANGSREPTAALTCNHSDGHIQTRDEFIDALESGRSVFRRIKLRDVSVQLAGNTALVRQARKTQPSV